MAFLCLVGIKWARSISMMMLIIFSVIIKESSDKVIDPGTLFIRSNLQNYDSPN